METQRGFTFVELLMTLALLGVLVLVAVPVSNVTVQRQKERELRDALIQVRAAIDAYKQAAEQGRVFQRIGDTGYPPSLEVLVEGVVDQRSPVQQRIYFLRRLPPDPFMADEHTLPERTWGLRSYESPPDAPRAGKDVFDVYSTSVRIGLNGVPYRLW